MMSREEYLALLERMAALLTELLAERRDSLPMRVKPNRIEKLLRDLELYVDVLKADNASQDLKEARAPPRARVSPLARWESDVLAEMPDGHPGDTGFLGEIHLATGYIQTKLFGPTAGDHPHPNPNTA